MTYMRATTHQPRATDFMIDYDYKISQSSYS